MCGSLAKWGNGAIVWRERAIVGEIPGQAGNDGGVFRFRLEMVGEIGDGG